MDALHRTGKLKLRVYAMLTPSQANCDRFLANGVYVTDRLTVRSVKMYADGALGSRGALLLEPYQDDPGNRGLQLAPRSRPWTRCAGGRRRPGTRSAPTASATRRCG